MIARFLSIITGVMAGVVVAFAFGCSSQPTYQTYGTSPPKEKRPMMHQQSQPPNPWQDDYGEPGYGEAS